MNETIKPPEVIVDKVKPIGIDMEPGEVGAILELVVKDKDGNITEHRVQKSESFVKQFMQLWYIQGYGLDLMSRYAPGITIKDTGNNDRIVANNSKMFDVTGAAGVTTKGIVVGSNNTAPTMSDYNLNTQIAHGTGSGQIQYGAVTFGAPSAGASISQFRITRDFANGSTGVISVAEIGLYTISDGTNSYMIIRDALSTAISVPIGQTLTVNYQIQASI